jgi:hypothetical protein
VRRDSTRAERTAVDDSRPVLAGMEASVKCDALTLPSAADLRLSCFLATTHTPLLLPGGTAPNAYPECVVLPMCQDGQPPKLQTRTGWTC